MRHQVLRVLFALSLILTITISAFAQADVSSATVKGTVTDPQGAAVANAVINVKDLDQGAIRTGTSDSNGEFQVRLVRPGLHDITVEARGFSQYSLKDIQLTVGQTATFEIKLQVEGLKTEVVVTTSAPLIEIERTQQANTIERHQIENLSNVGRNFQAYVYTLPGVSSSNAPRAQLAGRITGFNTSGFSIGGSNGRNNLVTVDGGENEYGSGNIRFDISGEAIQEFQVNRNSFTAEFGFTAGTAVNLITKSGTNQFHGSAYIFFRSQMTSARDPFDFNPSGKKSFAQQAFPGFTAGGPIVKNKLFFFTNYERQKNDDARFRTYTNNSLLQPTTAQAALLAQLDGSSDANLRRISANLRNALTTNATTYPTTFRILRESEGTFNGFARLNSWNTRMDYQINARDSINGRFTLTRNFTDDIGTSNATSPSIGSSLTYRDYSTVVTWIHSFGGNLINQMRGQYSPNNSAVTAPPEPARTSTLITGLAGFGRAFGAPYIVSQDRYQFEDTLTWLRGNHTFKFGGSYRPVKYIFRNDLWFAGEYQFQASALYPITLAVPAADRAAFVAAAGAAVPQLNPLQNFNFNQPLIYRQGFNNPTWIGTGHYLGGFAQDTWKIHPRLTLDLGGRIDWDGEPNPVPRHTYFSPRIGFAWQMTGDNKTVLRGGSGVFYSPIYIQIPGYTSVLNGTGKYINQIARSGNAGLPTVFNASAAGVYQAGINQGKYPFSVMTEADINALGISTAAGAAGRVLFDLNSDYKNNYAIQANLGIQRQITSNLSIDVAYQMYHGLHIQQPVAVNYCEAGTPGCPATAANLTALSQRDPRLGPLYRVCGADTSCGRINDAGITQFTDYQSRGSSIYHGLTVSLQRRFSQRISFQANYTFSKAIDDQTDFNSAFAPPFLSRLFTERSLSTFDIRHNFVFSGVFQSPFKSWALRDISISPSVFIRSGIPFTLRTGADINGDTRGGTDRLFNIGRNTGIGPNYRSVDVRISKAFRLRQDGPMRFELTADAANLFNRTNFAAVNEIVPVSVSPTGVLTFPTTLSATDYNAGTVRLSGRRDRDFTKGDPLSFTSAFNPRRILFGLKFVF
ncbi:MAG TPA: carboxypeptidase regulatory-like domain-containing protein [Blastocatellia bacterium]|nr:carboxypeptidase regulatory-like domain-containing protein [Blastocatellia bacterium]